MTKYELIFEEVQKRYASGEYTLEQAEEINDLAFNKYFCETVKSLNKDELESIQNLSKQIKNEIKIVKLSFKNNDKEGATRSVSKIKKNNNEIKNILNNIDDFDAIELTNKKRIAKSLMMIGLCITQLTIDEVSLDINSEKYPNIYTNDFEKKERKKSIKSAISNSLISFFISETIDSFKTKESYLRYCKKIDSVCDEFTKHISKM